MPIEDQPTDQYLLAVEAQRPAVEQLTATLEQAVAKHGRRLAIGATFAEVLNWVRQDPTSYAAVLVMAISLLTEARRDPKSGLPFALGGTENEAT